MTSYHSGKFSPAPPPPPQIKCARTPMLNAITLTQHLTRLSKLRHQPWIVALCLSTSFSTCTSASENAHAELAASSFKTVIPTSGCIGISFDNFLFLETDCGLPLTHGQG